MAEEGTAPAAGSAASAPDSGSAAGSVSSDVASAGSGNAPGSSVDAVATASDSAVSTPESVAAKFRILNREFTDQKHAEQILGSEIGKVRGLQRQNAEQAKEVESLRAQILALRQMVEGSGRVAEQGRTQGQQAPVGPPSFAKELVDNRELEIIAQMASNPEIGIAGAMYRMAELFDKRYQGAMEKLEQGVGERFESLTARTEAERRTVGAFRASQSLINDFPELDANNKSEEAQEAQQAILEIIKSLPQGAQWLASEPEEAFRYAAERYRRLNGAPVFAQPPGTSGSPSVKAALAAESQAASQAAVPLDGSGVPRSRPNGKPESAAERIRRENREIGDRTLKSPSGRSLWPSA